MLAKCYCGGKMEINSVFLSPLKIKLHCAHVEKMKQHYGERKIHSYCIYINCMFNLDLDFLAGRGGGGGGGGAGRTEDSKRARSLAAVNSHWKLSNTHYSQINCKESHPPASPSPSCLLFPTFPTDGKHLRLTTAAASSSPLPSAANLSHFKTEIGCNFKLIITSHTQSYMTFGSYSQSVHFGAVAPL